MQLRPTKKISSAPGQRCHRFSVCMWKLSSNTGLHITNISAVCLYLICLPHSMENKAIYRVDNEFNLIVSETIFLNY